MAALADPLPAPLREGMERMKGKPFTDGRFARYPERLWEIRDRRGRLLWRPQTAGGFATVGPLVERGEIVEECLWASGVPGRS